MPKAVKKHEVFEVYICRYNGEIVYVGEGRKGRSSHCNSGTSHVYELNKLHFEGVVFEVEVTVVPSKTIALEKEKELIRTYQPRFNKDGLEKSKYICATKRNDFKRRFKELVKFSRAKQSQKDRLYSIIEEYMSYHINQDVSRFKLRLAKPQEYKSVGLMKLYSSTSALMYKTETKGSTPDLLRTFLEQAYAEVYGDDTVRVTFDHNLWLDNED